MTDTWEDQQSAGWGCPRRDVVLVISCQTTHCGSCNDYCDRTSFYTRIDTTSLPVPHCQDILRSRPARPVSVSRPGASILRRPVDFIASSHVPTSITAHTIVARAVLTIPHSHHVTWKQEIRNPILDRILMLAVPANQLPIRNARLHQQRMQILERLGRLAVGIVQVLRTGGFCWQVGKTKLKDIHEHETLIMRDRWLYFCHQPFHRLPFQSWQHVLDEQRIHVHLDLFEFGFFGVEGKGSGRLLAHLACASQEVERQ